MRGKHYPSDAEFRKRHPDFKRTHPLPQFVEMSDPTMHETLGHLFSKDVEQRKEAIVRIKTLASEKGILDTEVVLRSLIRALNDSDETVRRYSVFSLSELTKHHVDKIGVALHILDALKKEKTVAVKVQMINSLANLAYEDKVVPIINELLISPYLEIRTASVDYLCAVMHRPSLPKLLERLEQEEDPGIRASIALGLRIFKDLSLIPKLKTRLSTELHMSVRDALRKTISVLERLRIGDTKL